MCLVRSESSNRLSSPHRHGTGAIPRGDLYDHQYMRRLALRIDRLHLADSVAGSRRNILPLARRAIAALVFCCHLTVIRGQVRLSRRVGRYLRGCRCDMPDPSAVPLFRCSRCFALYQVIKAPADPETVDLEIACRVCNEPLAAREGQFVLKYFLLREASRMDVRRAQRGSLRTQRNKTSVPNMKKPGR
jgi:hypothetical protein